MTRLSLLLTSLLAVMLTACGGSHRATDKSEAFTDEIYTPEYARCFKILANADGQKLLEVYQPWQSETSADTARLIIPAEGFQRIVCMSSTHLAYIDELNELDRVVGVSGMQYISLPGVLQRSAQLVDVGYDAAMNYEALIAARPDAVLIYGVGARSGIEDKLKELDVPYVYIADFVEQDPLGRAEWLVALGALVGKTDFAEQRFREIASAYQQIRSQAKAGTQRPKVMLNAPYASSWFMPAVNSEIAHLIDDAGGDYIYRENTGNGAAPIDMEQAVMLLRKADIWLNTGQLKTLNDLRQAAPKAKFAGPVYNHRGSFFETGMVHPERILEDLTNIFHGNDTTELHYYFRLQ